MTDNNDPTQAAPAEDAVAPAQAAAKPAEAKPTEVAATPEGERIAKAIARAGIASRRDAEALIEAGRVTLNGQVLTSPAMNVTDSDRITVDGEPLPARERTRLWILHKPRGVVTTARDPEGRATVFDGLPDDLPRVVAIGRLDINTEGLLLLTNDGGLAKVIAHPDTGWLRRYRVRAFGDVNQADLDKLKKGVTIEGMEYGPVEATLDRAQGDNVWLTLGLREGKNREVKRILEHLGLSVNRLIRLSFGPFQLGDLEVGLVEEIRTKVLKEQLGKSLAEEAGVDFESPVREAIAPFGSPKKAAKGQGQAAARAQDSERPAPRPRSAGARPPRDPARPAASGRGAGAPAKPQRAASPTVWRADDEDRPRAAKVPRRGGDPKAARAAAAERGRERVGAITAVGERRVLVERLQATPEAPAPEPHRRVRFRNANEEGAERQERRPREDRPERGQGYGQARGQEQGDARSAGPRRAPAGDARPRRRDDEGGAERRGPPRERPSEGRPFRERSEAAPRRERSFDGASPERRGPPRDRPRPERSGDGERPTRAPRGEGRPDSRSEGRPERSGGGFKGAGRPAGGGGKPGFKGGARQGEARDGAKGGGFKGGGFKAGGGGGRPGGGFKGGGARPGGSRPGGAGGGGRPGGKPGGSRGGGRPPRGGA
ncbi:RNA-binding protein [Methylobacterium sp. Leaf456]|uniref:pseudouridine synthase n=1 Tax=Methylobacterium sp. Leaf456 TaxID=1736382 RepID=UPI000701DA5A|nr:pseudouridine synthase [Methylobacterium sp. Leaf456]KQT60142.1 RNA-binding protein [Methylobacterium sp. Leaf456]